MQRNYVGKQYKWDFIILSFAFCFMFCVFAPLDAYFGNTNEYWFTVKDLLPVILVVFAVSLCILSLFFLLLGRFKWAPIAFAFFTALLLFFYVQGNCIPRNYGVLNGSEIDWAKYTGLGLASIALAAICIVLFLALILKFRDKVFVIGRYLALFIIAIQVMTLGTSFIQKNLLARGKTTRNTVVTDNNLFSFSGDGHNIVVFLLDTFDSGRYMEELYKENPVLCEETLENFTWYRDTAGMYPTTKAALPEILTGIWYENEVPYDDYVAKAYEESAVIPSMAQNGYSLDVYTLAEFLSQKQDVYTNVFSSSYHVSDPVGFAQYFYRLILFNYMPHQLKSAFVVNTAGFDRFRGVSTTGEAFSEDVQEFYQRLIEEGIKAENRGNLFKFYHLEGVHAAYTFGEDLKTVEGESYTALTEAAGNMTLLKEAFAQMKSLGIYDDSTIIVMADHGLYQHYNVNPIYMIKNRNEAHPLEISNVKMSYEYMSSVFTELADGGEVNAEFIGAQQPVYGQRRFLFYSWDNGWNKEYLPGMEEFFIDGNAWNLDDLKPSGVQFIPDEKPVEYILGKELSFLSDATAVPYCVYGFTACGEQGNPTDGAESMIKLKVKGEYENLLFSLNAEPIANSVNVQVYANNHEVGSFIINKKDTYTLVIPGEYLEEEVLRLKLRYENLNDSKDTSSNSGVKRIHYLYMRSVSLTSTGQAFDLDAQKASVWQAYRYMPGEILLFSKDSPTANDHMISGFSNNEEGFTWTDGKAAEMVFTLADSTGDVCLKMQYYTFNGSQRVEVSVNDHVLEEYIAHGEEEKTIVIPAEAIDDGVIRLRLGLPDACSSYSLGINQDTRELALGFKSIVLLVDT